MPPPAAPHASQERNSDIDLGLEILGTMPVPPGGWLLEDIAEICGCSKERIRQLEERALRKISGSAIQKGLTPHDVRRALKTGGSLSGAVKVGGGK